MQGAHGDTFDSCFVPFRLNYSETKSLAVGVAVTSDVISAGGHRWRFRCYPRWNSGDNQGEYVCIFLDLMSKSKGVKAIFEVFVTDKNGEPSSSHAKRCVHVYSNDGLKDWKGWAPFVKRSDLEPRYVMNGVVTLVCGIVVARDDGPLAVPPSDMASHLARLLDCCCTDYGSDVSFVVAGETFAAHRAVLAARSPVFKAELFGSMQEATASHITLQDIEPAAFKVFLWFMYTDALPGDDDLGDDSPLEMYQQLLAVADRYAMDRLKVWCARKLWDHVSVDTAADVLACAETYDCPELKRMCIAFFQEEKNFRNAVLTMVSCGWFRGSHRLLLREKAKK